ncbi:MAG TPA: alcohol dehydrogenase catalytic domain-containing protein [Actinomycetota bacterium]|nr:alcohol dehydrogenase catalytic domain-containing protein [Actinomycetota bacterium]
MRAVVYEDVGRVRVADVPDPVVSEADDAVIRVTTSAICGSDLHFFHGKAPLDPGEGVGHEAVGIVERVGPAVERVRPGDRVAVSFVIACGACWFCKAGQTQLCEDFRNLGAGILGGDLGGAQAELLRVPHADTNLLTLPDTLDDEHALFLGDILTTGVYGAEVADVRPGDTVAVVGAGPVGFFAIQAALARGADRVLALDLLSDRLSLAERAGAEAIDVVAQHPQMAVAERTGDRGADVVIEAVGHLTAFETAIDVVRRGGRVAVVGMYTSETTEVPMGIWWARALDVRFAGVCPVHAWWGVALDDVVERRIDPLPVVSHRLPLDDAPLGYELFASRRATKVLLLP